MKLRTFLACTAASALLMQPSAAHASPTLSVNGSTTPGAIQGVGTLTGNLELESNYAVAGQCLSGAPLVELDPGTTLIVGNQIGSVKGASMSSCSMISGLLSVALVPLTYPFSWPIRMTETPSIGQRFVDVEIQNIDLLMHSSSQPLGSWRTAVLFTGNLEGTIDTITDVLIINPDFALHAEALDESGNNPPTAESTMSGEIWDGDLFSVNATFALGLDIEVD